MRDINTKDFAKLRKCFKITLKNGEILTFNNSSQNITVDDAIYTASTGFNAENKDFYSDLTSGESNIIGFLDSDNIKLEEILSGKFDKATVEIFFIDVDSKERINITKGQIKSIKLDDGKVYINIGSVLDVLDKNIGEIFSPMCRAKFCDSKCSLNIENYTFYGEIADIKNETEFICNNENIKNKEKNYFKYGIITFTTGENKDQSTEIKQSFNNTLILTTKFTYSLNIGDSFKVTAGCDKDFKTCCNVFNNAVNFRGEPFIESTSKMYKFY